METALIARGARLFAACILSALVSLPSFAENQPLTLREAIETSLRHNGVLTSFREEQGIRDAGTTRAGTLPNPTLELEVETGGLTGSSSDNSLAIGISQEFLTSGKRVGRLTVAGRDQELSRLQLADRERTVRAEVAAAFHDAILAMERITLAERFVDLNRHLVNIAKERLSAGEIPELEMNLAMVELSRSEGKRIEAEANLVQARSRLTILMGTRVMDDPPLSGTLEGELPPGTNRDELVRTALLNRPDLKALEVELSKNDAEAALASAEAIPNLSASLMLRRESSAFETGGFEGKDTAYTVAMKFSMPLPLFDRNQAGVQEARARRNSTEARLTSVRREIEGEVKAAHAAYLNADRILSLYRTGIIPQLEENLNLTREAYRLGEVGILSLIQEQKAFFEENEAYLTALHARRAALTKLESAVAAEITGAGGVQ